MRLAVKLMPEYSMSLDGGVAVVFNPQHASILSDLFTVSIALFIDSAWPVIAAHN